MKKARMVLLCLLWAGAALQPASLTADLKEATFQRQAYAGSKDRDYLIYLPRNFQANGPLLPLVVVLHGCNQTHRDIMQATRFNALAEAENFIVVYPFITRYDGIRNPNCWGFWIDAEIHQGQGEVADIAGIIQAVQGQYPINPLRIHIVGLSSGGAMATAVMVAYSEIIASGAPAAGLAYKETACAVTGTCFTFNWFNPATWLDWYGPRFQSIQTTADAMDMEMGTDRRMVPTLLLHSADDPKVKIEAAHNNAKAWASMFAIDMDRPVAQSNGETAGRTWTHKGYGPAIDAIAIETLFVDGAPHGWVGGGQGPYADPKGPDWSRIAWDFFKRHRLDPQP